MCRGPSHSNSIPFFCRVPETFGPASGRFGETLGSRVVIFFVGPGRSWPVYDLLEPNKGSTGEASGTLSKNVQTICLKHIHNI